ncbi:uncharacterized protein LOC135379011 [Ornithodoros turicata]|uniref:uncharacterized protein LOC135379011 n=1 Tax=Ornithodoros turicata TaxID=34597 RepID=UPI00313941A7
MQQPEMIPTASGLPVGELVTLFNKLRSSKCCKGRRTKECVLLNSLLTWNKVLWCSGFSLTETDPGVLTMSSSDICPVTMRGAAFLEMSTHLISEHKSIKYFCFHRIEVDILERILASLESRSDVRGFILGTTYDDRRPSSFLGSYESPINPLTTLWFRQITEAVTSATMILRMVRQATSLEVFHIEEGSVRNDAAVQLGCELAKKPSLETLLLTEFCREVSTSYIATLRAMEPADRVKIWNVSSLTLRGCTADQCRQLCGLLVSNTIITYLNLSGTYSRTSAYEDEYDFGVESALGDEGVVMLADALSRNSTISVLVLQDVGFHQEGAAALGRLIVINTVIHTLDISRNELGTDECIALASGLQFARFLKELIIEKCDVTRSGAMRISEALLANKSCRRVSFGQVSLLKDNMSQLDCVQLALRNTPGRIQFMWDTASVLSGHILLGHPQHVKKIIVECGGRGIDFPPDRLCAFLEQDGTVVDKMRLILNNPSYALGQRLAGCLRRKNGLRCLSLRIGEGTNDATSEALARGLQANTTLCSLCLEANADEVVRTFAPVISKNKVLSTIWIVHVISETLTHELEQHMMSNYAITEFRLPFGSSRSLKQQIETLVTRNRVLQGRSLCFVLEDTIVKKRWIKAFELTRDTGTLRRAVMSKPKKSEEEAQCLINGRLRYIRYHYFTITGISKGRIVCNASPTGATQLHNLNAKCLSHIASYLRITDVM